MPQRLLLSLLFFLPLLAFSQKSAEVTPTKERTVKENLISLQKLRTDTIFPAILADTCANRVVAYTVGDGGYVFGSNSYGDLLKLQRFVYPGDDPYALTTVLVAFSGFDSSIVDRRVAIEIYGDLKADSSFGDFLGTSDSIRIGDLMISDTEVQFTTFTFPTPVVVNSDSFLVAVDFSDTYRAETDGYLGVYSTRDNCGDGRNVLEIYPTQSGLAYGSIFSDWQGLNAEMFMLAVVDTDINTSTRNVVADYGATISPNPTSGTVALSFRTSGGAEYRSSLTDLNGRTLRETTIHEGGNGGQTEWDLSNLPTGLYLYHLDGPAGRQSGKLIKR